MVKGLLCKCEVWSSNPNATKKEKKVSKENFKKNFQKKMLESKITVAEVKNAFDGLISRLNIWEKNQWT
jgi:hypothetical protein